MGILNGYNLVTFLSLKREVQKCQLMKFCSYDILAKTTSKLENSWPYPHIGYREVLSKVKHINDILECVCPCPRSIFLWMGFDACLCFRGQCRPPPLLLILHIKCLYLNGVEAFNSIKSIEVHPIYIIWGDISNSSQYILCLHSSQYILF